MDGTADDDGVRALIATRAYELWENQGRPSGCHMLHWRQAEQEIIGCLPGGVTSRAKPDVTGTRGRKVPPAYRTDGGNNANVVS